MLHVSTRSETLFNLPKRIARSFLSWPDMEDFKLVQMTNGWPFSGPRLTSSVLKRIASLTPQTLNLYRLRIEGLSMDGEDLIDVLEAHKRHLRRVCLRELVLTNARECMEALSRTQVDEVWFEDVKVRENSGNLQRLTP